MLSIDIRKSLHGSGGDITLHIETQIDDGSFVAIAGESGSGKTTFLRILAGLEKADGHISMGSQVWLDTNRSLAPQKRKTGFVFQDYALFDNMTVEKNLLFVSNEPKLERELLELTSMSEMSHRYPSTLSGGQKQRVALCRAMMRRPELLLMDEPLSALDPAMRSRLQREIGELHRRFGTITIMVSHDPGEIYRLADRVIVLERGEMAEDGTPAEIFLEGKESRGVSLYAEVVDIVRRDTIFTAVVSGGNSLIEVVIDRREADTLKRGDIVEISAGEFCTYPRAIL